MRSIAHIDPRGVCMDHLQTGSPIATAARVPSSLSISPQHLVVLISVLLGGNEDRFGPVTNGKKTLQRGQRALQRVLATRLVHRQYRSHAYRRARKRHVVFRP